MPAYPSLPEFESPVNRNEEALLLYLQRFRQSLEDNISQVAANVIIDAELRSIEFLVTSLNTALTPNARMLEVETGVLGLLLTSGLATLSVLTHGLDYEKIQQVTGDRLLGKVGAAGTIEEIEIAYPLFFNGLTLSSTAPSVKRVVDIGETRVILDEHSLVASRYFDIQGTLTIEGDGTLEII